MTLIRMQDCDGRGPWKPGFSCQWSDVEGPPLPKPITSSIPNFRAFVMGLHKKGLHIGCAVWASKKAIWFSLAEETKLAALGYRWHDAGRCEIAWEGEEQVLIASRVHLRKLPVWQMEATP